LTPLVKEDGTTRRRDALRRPLPEPEARAALAEARGCRRGRERREVRARKRRRRLGGRRSLRGRLAKDDGSRRRRGCSGRGDAVAVRVAATPQRERSANRSRRRRGRDAKLGPSDAAEQTFGKRVAATPWPRNRVAAGKIRHGLGLVRQAVHAVPRPRGPVFVLRAARVIEEGCRVSEAGRRPRPRGRRREPSSPSPAAAPRAVVSALRRRREPVSAAGTTRTTSRTTSSTRSGSSSSTCSGPWSSSRRWGRSCGGRDVLLHARPVDDRVGHGRLRGKARGPVPRGHRRVRELHHRPHQIRQGGPHTSRRPSSRFPSARPRARASSSCSGTCGASRPSSPSETPSSSSPSS